ncbi:MAG: UDP-N-acetylmuramoyl-L-alanyl-D-glutamate--2,6-diaminopimelate ligase [Clostridia bacterium]|nr:UDP-N-acetylmuramoyl-L-alanyl-D-glutamate--2,6-diaminopimelate ligase [Clostridia bacterium]
MRLSKMLEGLVDATVIFQGKDFDREISGIFHDSRFVRNSSLFICLTGGKTDGHNYALEAVQSGAVALVVERELPIKVPQVLVKDTREAMACLSSTFYGNPARRLKIIGITGTNGKTTTAHLLSSILRRAGKNVAVVGTLGVCYGQKRVLTDMTTPDPIEMHKFYADMLACGVEYVVEEVSAHALFYKKDAGIRYDACIFTNLTQDHLDFFADMQTYKQAKTSLFSLGRTPLAVVNADDDCGREIIAMRGARGVVSYGLDTPADCFAVLTGEDIYSQRFMMNLDDDLCRVSLKLIGKHNIYNALAASACAYKLGVNLATIACGLKEVDNVNGRLERVAEYNGAPIFVDFAHTPDGLKNSLSTLRKYLRGRLVCVFGCGGNRDKSKRQEMGRIAAGEANFCVLTSDNPRYEDPLDIITEIEKGYRAISRDYVIVPDREKAIEYALGVIGDGDALILAGKGGEDTQEIMGIKYPFNDKDILRKIISKEQ